MTDDPFSDAADPYRADPSVSRRDLAKLVALPVLAAPLVTSCAHVPLGCKPAAKDGHSCQHRFCRNFRR
jgi:hypothetical protein